MDHEMTTITENTAETTSPAETKKENAFLKKVKNIFKKNKQGMVTKSSGLGIVFDIVLVIIMLIFMFIAVIPVWHTLMASLSNGAQAFSHKGLFWGWVNTEGGINFSGYAKTISYSDYAILKSYGITLVYVAGNVLLGLVLNVIGGYCLSVKTKLYSPMVIFFTLTLMFGGGMIPTYIVVSKLGLTDNIGSLIIPNCTMAMNFIIVMNAFKSVPQSTIEAAKLDGAGDFRIMFQIMLPQAMGLTTVVMINTAIGTWNSWFEASIYVPNSPNLWPLQIWIQKLSADTANILQSPNPDWDNYLVQFCAIFVTMLPIIIAMPWLQKKLQNTSLMGAVKE